MHAPRDGVEKSGARWRRAYSYIGGSIGRTVAEKTTLLPRFDASASGAPHVSVYASGEVETWTVSSSA